MPRKVVARGLEARIARIAARQYGLVTHRQLVAVGLSAGGVQHRIANRRLRAIHRGVYAAGHQPLTREGRWLAAVLACGGGAALSHRAAAALWGLLPRAGEGRIDVTVLTAGGRASRPGIRVHRCRLEAPELAARDGIPATTVARTLLDLAAVLPRRTMERALDEADYLGFLDQRALAATLARHPRRNGAGALKRILAEHSIGSTRTRSELEERLLALCRRRRLPLPAVNVHVEGFLVDFYWPAARLVVETDGYAAHRRRAAFEEDRVRTVTLSAAGYEVLRFTHRQVFGDAEWVGAHIERTLGRSAAAARTPGPPPAGAER